MPGWTCCDAWERWKIWTADRTELQRLPCVTRSPGCEIIQVFCWLNGSDNPAARGNRKWDLNIERKSWSGRIGRLVRPQNRTQRSRGASGVK